MKIVIITGLTATGKSELALELAKKYNGEIISADSVQVYKGLNIGSAKESPANREIIKHHLIDIKDIDETYNVGQFLTDCKKAIIDINSRGNLPIIVGGTGLYIKALLCGYNLGGANADLKFRAHWQETAREHGNDFVWQELNKLNPEKAKSVHPNNLKRVIRYLELEQNTGTTPKETINILLNYEICAVGIVEDRDIIYKRIDDRVDKMMLLGLKDEVKKLIKLGAKSTFQSMNSIGYKEWFDYFKGNQTEKRTVELIKQHSRNYCKRQLTFLKTIPDLKLCKIDDAKKLIEEFLNDRN